MPIREETLLTLLAYDGLVYVLECQYWLKFSVHEVEPSNRVPHGVAYSFTMHSPDGLRVLGFDNAHPVPRLGSQHVRDLSLQIIGTAMASIPVAPTTL